MYVRRLRCARDAVKRPSEHVQDGVGSASPRVAAVGVVRRRADEVALELASPAGSSAVLRQLNSSMVFDVVKRSAVPLRVAEIVKVTGLSRPTVETVAEGLLEQGWVTVDDPDRAPGGRLGRPARRYSFNASAGRVLGIDIGAHTVALCVADLRGDAIATIRRRVSPDIGARRRLAVAADAATALLAETQIDRSSVFAVTVGTPGTVSPRNRRIGKSPGMPGWSQTDLIAVLQERVGFDVELENDANLAAVGERARGVAQDCDDMLFLLLGERLGAGVIANGTLIRGSDGAAGEVGYAPAAAARIRPPGIGPLESLVNARALVELGRRALAKDRQSRLADLCGGDPARLTAEAITLAASEGDLTATRALRTQVRALAKGIAPALLTLNPDVLVLGGGMSRAGDVLRDLLMSQIEDLLLYPPEVRISALGDEAVLVGAVDQSIKRVELNVLSKVSA
jgi:predicted NBD/HSP70 family sugar kinase